MSIENCKGVVCADGSTKSQNKISGEYSTHSPIPTPKSMWITQVRRYATTSFAFL